MPFSPEFRLAAACALWPPSPHRQAKVLALAEAVDWTLFCGVVQRHRIAGLVQDGLKRAGLPTPEPIGRQAAQFARRSLVLAGETVRLQQAFHQAGVTVAFLKGAPLAMEAYGDPGLRHSKDIDVVIRPADAEAAWRVLESSGYVRRTPPADLSPAQLRLFMRLSKDSALDNRALQTEVELHWRLTDDAEGLDLPPVEHWTTATVGGAAITTFGETDRFLYLCAHGSGHAWMRLKWLADIAALIGGRADLVDRFWRAAIAANATRPVEVALRLAAQLFESPLPEALTAPPSRRVRWLMNLSVRTLTAGDGIVELNTTALGHIAEPLAGLLLARGLGGQIRLALKTMVSPEDVVLLRLPGPLQFLYPVLRIPVWIGKTVRGYGRRGRP